MKYTKTEPGQQAFKQRSPSITARQRSLFILFDGQKTVDQVLAATTGMGATAADVQSLVDQGYLAPVEGLMRTLMWLAGGLVALMLLMTGAVVVLAANSAHAAHRGTIDIIHMLGATDLQLARLFQRRIALDAALGAMAGTVSAAALLWLLDSNLHVSQSELAGLIRLPWRSVAILFGLPLFAVLVAALTARITVMRALERNL